MANSKMHLIGKIINHIKTSLSDFLICYFPKMEIDSIKITKSQYDKLKNEINDYCNNVVNEINDYKKNGVIKITEGTEALHGYEIVSQIGDYLGPVILMDGEYYRCIKKDAVPKFIELWESGILQVFSAKGFMPKIDISEFCSDEWPIILKQQKITIKKIEDTTIEESKKALFFVSILQLVCKKVNCVLLDPHFYNYTINESGFMFYDLGSFFMTNDISNYNDFSMVILGAYRILFSYFPGSVLSKQELGVFRTGIKKYKYTARLHEFSFYRRRGRKCIKRFCTKNVVNAYRNIFYSYKCLPWDVLICFLPKFINNPLSLVNI